MFTPHPEIQYASAAEIKTFQEERLREAISYAAAKSPFYKEMFAKTGIAPESIRTIEDLRRLPLTTKQDLQSRNADFICVGQCEIADYVTTSGTLGDPVTIALTQSDIERLAYNEELSFGVAGCSEEDIMQLMVTLDRRFMAGFAYYLGARAKGMGVCRVGNGIPQLQWDTIGRIRPTVGMCVPSFLMKLIDHAEQNGIDHHTSSIKKFICIGEALRTPDGQYTKLGQQIAARWPEVSLYTTYASTEMQSSFTECEHFCGGHSQPELIVVEFLDDAGQPVGEGEVGEVTITTLGIEGTPLIRFRTGDMVNHYTGKCACGRQTTRLGSVVGRKGQMIKFKGTTLYPPAIFDILDGIGGIVNYVVEVYTNDLGTDEVKVRVGSQDTSDAFAKRIKDIFRARVRVAPSVSFESPDYINKIMFPPMSRKAVKFIDLR